MQVVYLPNGIIGSVFIKFMREHDNGVQNISGLNEDLMELLLSTHLVLRGVVAVSFWRLSFFAC